MATVAAPSSGSGEGAKRGPARGPAVDLDKLLDKRVRVKIAGGREVVGVLKGYDQLFNLVLDETVEYLRDPKDSSVLLDETRPLGLLVTRGTNVTVVLPEDGMTPCENPFQ